MRNIFNNRLFKGQLTYKGTPTLLYMHFCTENQKKCIKISLSEFGVDSIPLYYHNENKNGIHFYIWDSVMLGECMFTKEHGVFILSFKNVLVVDEKEIILLEVKDTIDSPIEMKCGIILEYNRYQDYLLKKNYSFGYKGNLEYEYNMSHNEYVMLRSFINFKKINKLTNDFDKAIYAMRSLHKVMIARGITSYIPERRSAYSLLTAKLNNSILLNCRGCAIVLNDMLLSMGIPSKFIACMSSNPYDPECHVINSVYIKEYKKWILLDAATQMYVEGDNRIPLSILEVHNKLIRGERVRFMISPEIPNFNLTRAKFENYLIKNMFCFLSYKKYEPYCDDWGNRHKKYLLLPSNNDTLYTRLCLKDCNIDITNNPVAFFG